jgi:tetratricopeptide (TPR) repeat protein
MKKLLGLLVFILAFQINAQDNNALLKHYKAYYKQMKTQGDMHGVINAITHLNILSPNKARLDTLAVLYMNDGKHVQALNTLGVEINEDDSDMAVEVKAVSLKTLNQPKLAAEQFTELFKRKPNVLIAYELADLKIQLDDLIGASVNITYGIANSKDDIKRTFYDQQAPYEVPIKAGFIYLKGLIKFKENNELNIDAAIAFFDEALQIAPNFNLAKIGKNVLIAKKTPVKKD